MNPSKAKVKKCFLCGHAYPEQYGIPFSEVWLCGDCLNTIPIEKLPSVLKKVKENGKI